MAETTTGVGARRLQLYSEAERAIADSLEVELSDAEVAALLDDAVRFAEAGIAAIAAS
jgi:hypothetical protein